MDFVEEEKQSLLLIYEGTVFENTVYNYYPMGISCFYEYLISVVSVLNKKALLGLLPLEDIPLIISDKPFGEIIAKWRLTIGR